MVRAMNKAVNTKCLFLVLANKKVYLYLDNAPTQTSSSAVVKLHQLMTATSCDT